MIELIGGGFVREGIRVVFPEDLYMEVISSLRHLRLLRLINLSIEILTESKYIGLVLVREPCNLRALAAYSLLSLSLPCIFNF